MATNGNAGAAWAAYAARAGLPSLIVMAADAPAVHRAECLAVGAELRVADGSIADAARLVAAEVPGRAGYQDVSTLKEPYRIEGKKTMGFEIAEQLGWRLPDVIVYPTGGGVGIIGIYKALPNCASFGWTGRQPLPRLVAVQATGCAPIVKAFASGARPQRAVAGCPDGRLRHHGAQGTRRLPRARRPVRHRGDRRRRGRRGAARGPAPGRAPGRAASSARRARPASRRSACCANPAGCPGRTRWSC